MSLAYLRRGLDTWAGDVRAEKRGVETAVLIDARSLAEGTEVVCDLAVVGAGPSGIAIVDRLRNSGVKACLIESGGFEPDLRTQDLYRGENVGHRYFGLHTCRFRMFGGSSNRWGGWCRPLEPLDFEQRDWVPHSGWPIRYDTLEPYFGDASTLFELSGPRFDLDSWAGRLPEPFVLGGGDFENAIFQYSPETNFGEVYKDRILHAPNVTILIHSNIVEIGLEPGTNIVSALFARALGGPRFVIRPRAAVLAAGGIENARLLLASRSDRPAGLGNEHDLVGRFFMEHLHVPAGHLVVEGMAPSRDFYRKAVYGSSTVRGVITPSADAQRRRRLTGLLDRGRRPELWLRNAVLRLVAYADVRPRSPVPEVPPRSGRRRH